MWDNAYVGSPFKLRMLKLQKIYLKACKKAGYPETPLDVLVPTSKNYFSRSRVSAVAVQGKNTAMLAKEIKLSDYRF